jgi:hypothetical protein
MEGKINWPFNCLCSICLHFGILGRWMRGYEHPYGMECLQKLFKPNRCQATNYQKPPRAYMVNIYGINLFNFINSYTKDVIIFVLRVFWSRYQCKYGPEDYRKNSTHTQSIKRRCLTSFWFKRLYIWPDVAEIKIYHNAHARIDGSFAHGEHDPESISCMSHYAPCMSQTLKDHIWAQLSLGYTIKQIYDKHKTIWWERVNAGQSMTRDDFIRLQDIAYLDWKH